MKKYNITNNYYFLTNDNFQTKYKNQILEKIEIIEKLENNDDCMLKIALVLEDFLCAYIESNNIDYLDKFEKLSFDEKLKHFNETYNKSISRSSRSAMQSIRVSRNTICHESRREPLIIHEIISKMKELFVIIKEMFPDLFKNDDPDEKSTFCAEIYNDLRNISKASFVPIIKTDLYNLINNDLSIDKIPIFECLNMNNARIMIPIYQRKYEWNIENVTMLHNDILKRMEDNNSHYFGVIACKKKISNNKIISDVKIIDGQQRLTTSLILFAAIRDVLKDEFDVNYKDDSILSDIFRNNIENYFYNPGGTEANNRTFRKIISNDINYNQNKDFSKDNNYFKNYVELKKLITESCGKNKEKLFIYTSTFASKFEVALITFDANKHSNKQEMEIFENLNSKGVPLHLIDLVKNYIFNFCSDELLKQKDNEIIKKFNRMLSEVDADKESRKQKDLLSDFYISIAEMSSASGCEISSDSQIRFWHIKNSISSLFDNKNFDTVEEFTSNLQKLFKKISMFNELVNETSTSKWIDILNINKFRLLINDAKKRRLFVYFGYGLIDLLEKTYGDVLGEDFYFHSDYIKRIDKKHVASINSLFHELCKFIIRAKVISTQGDSNVRRLVLKKAYELTKDKISMQSIEKYCEIGIDKIKDLYALEAYSSDKFYQILMSNNTKGPKWSLWLLQLVENTMSDGISGKGDSTMRANVSIEHIMPQDKSKWVKLLINSDEKELFNEKHSQNVEKIGNFLLLTRSKNSSASNDLFSNKMHIYKNSTSLLFKNPTFKDIDISGKQEWTFDNINKRTAALTNYIKKNIYFE